MSLMESPLRIFAAAAVAATLVYAPSLARADDLCVVMHNRMLELVSLNNNLLGRFIKAQELERDALKIEAHQTVLDQLASDRRQAAMTLEKFLGDILPLVEKAVAQKCASPWPGFEYSSWLNTNRLIRSTLMKQLQ